MKSVKREGEHGRCVAGGNPSRMLPQHCVIVILVYDGPLKVYFHPIIQRILTDINRSGLVLTYVQAKSGSFIMEYFV